MRRSFALGHLLGYRRMTVPWASQVRGDLPARFPAAAAREGDAGEGSPRMEVRPRDQDPVTQAPSQGRVHAVGCAHWIVYAAGGWHPIRLKRKMTMKALSWAGLAGALPSPRCRTTGCELGSVDRIVQPRLLRRTGVHVLFMIVP